MKFSQMFELKGPTQENKKKKKSKKMPYEVFMGIMFIICGYLQAMLFMIIGKVYEIPTKNTILAACALLVIFLNISIGVLCIASRVYEKNKTVAILMILLAIMWIFGAIIFALIEAIGGGING